MEAMKRWNPFGLVWADSSSALRFFGADAPPAAAAGATAALLALAGALGAGLALPIASACHGWLGSHASDGGLLRSSPSARDGTSIAP